MARTPNTTTVPADPDLDQDRVNNAMQVMQADALALREATAQRDATVRAVALQMGYQLPADCTDPDMIQRDISANMRRSVEACLEVGRGLATLRAACEHGQFVARLDVLGVEPRLAQRFMQAAAKFSKASGDVTLKIGSQSKLFELLVLDDDQVDELLLTGQTGELNLDDVATMSVKEVRALARELRHELKAKDGLLATKNESLDKLKTKLRRIPQATPDEAAAQLRHEATQTAFAAQAAVQGNLALALQALDAAGTEAGDPALHQLFMAGLVGCVQAELTKLRDAYGLPDVSSAADQQLADEVAAWSNPKQPKA
jgi:hypothetical protein